MSNIIYATQEKYLNGFITENDSLLIEMEEYASENKVPILGRQSSAFLEQMIRIYNPANVLEIGTAIAYSTIKIARNLKKKGTVDTIELSKDNAKLAKDYIKRSGAGSKINLIEGDALKVMPKLTKTYDFIFLDADKEDYKQLFDYSLIHLKKGGVIFVDNLLWHGYAASAKIPTGFKTSTQYIRNFNKIFMSQKNLQAVILPVGDGIGLGIKN